MSINPASPALAPESAPRTMVYTVDLGNGHVADVEGPEGATPEQLQQAVSQQQGSPQPAGAPVMDNSGTEYAGGLPDELPAQPRTRLSPEVEAQVHAMIAQPGMTPEALQAYAARIGGGATLENAKQLIDAYRATGKINPDTVYQLGQAPDDGALAAGGRGALDTLSLGTLPKLGAAVAGVGSALSGGSFGDAYDRALDANNAAVSSDEENHPWARVAGQLLGGLALPTGMEGVGLKVGTDVLRAGGTMQEARAAVNVAVRNRMAIVGAGYGAAHGAGSADTLGDAVTGAASEGAIGAAGGAALGAAASRLKPRASPAPPSVGQETVAAADRLGIGDTILPADVGGPTVRRLTAAGAQAPLSASPIITASQAGRDAAQGARDRIASEVGQALDPEATGLSVRAGAQKYIASSGQDVRDAYAAAERLSAGVPVTPAKALANLDAHIADLAETPGGAPGLQQMQGLRDALAKGDVSVPGIMRMRSVLRDQFMRDGLRGSDVERRIGQVLDSAQQDVTDSLTAAGRPEAARAYAVAAAKYRTRINTIDTVLKPLIGTRDQPRSGEAVAKTLMADLQGNNARAARLLRTLPPEERSTTVASIIGALGQKGDVFSLDSFATQWGQKIGKSAKAAFFAPETRAALDDLYRVAQSTKQAQTYANRSNTSGGIWGNVGAWLSASLVSPTATVAGIGGQYAAGRLLSSPRFARWLARAPRSSLAPAAYIDRLSRIARAEPAIANEVLQLQRRLSEAFTASPARLAAQEPDGESAVGNRQ